MAGRYQEQHPIPQNISSYQFRLVGDMTLKQFFQVAGGALVAILLYSSQLAPFIKWPLMTLAFLFGVALAFLPLEDRPLEKWIVLFFKAIYSPTQFKWQSGTKTEYFADENADPVDLNAAAAESAQLASVQAQSPTRVSSNAPVGIHAEATQALTGLESSEKEYLSTLQTQMTNSASAQIPSAPPSTTAAPSTTNVSQTPSQPVSTAPVESSAQVTPPLPTQVPFQIVPEQPDTPLSDPTVTNITVKTTSASPVQTPTPEPVFEPTPVLSGAPPTSSTDAPPKPIVQAPSISEELAMNMPSIPSRNNILVGLVVSDQDAILDNVILEIRDKAGRPARAMKSNKLGQFSIATPLPEGSYVISAEKDGFEFETVNLEVADSIIDPLIIKAKSH